MVTAQLKEIYSLICDVRREAFEENLFFFKLIFDFNRQILEDNGWIENVDLYAQNIPKLHLTLDALFNTISFHPEATLTMRTSLSLIQHLIQRIFHGENLDHGKESVHSVETDISQQNTISVVPSDHVDGFDQPLQCSVDESSLPTFEFTSVPFQFDDQQIDPLPFDSLIDLFGDEKPDTSVLELQYESYERLIGIFQQLYPLSDVIYNEIWSEMTTASRMNLESATKTNSIMIDFLRTTTRLISKLSAKPLEEVTVPSITTIRVSFDFPEHESIGQKLYSDILSLFTINPVTPTGKSFTTRASWYTITFPTLTSIKSVVWSYFISQSRLFALTSNNKLIYRFAPTQSNPEATNELMSTFATKIFDSFDQQSFLSQISIAAVAALTISSIDFNPIQESTYPNCHLSLAYFSRFAAKNHTLIISRILHMFAALKVQNQHVLLNLSPTDFQMLIVRCLVKVDTIFSSGRLQTRKNISYELSDEYTILIQSCDIDLEQYAAEHQHSMGLTSLNEALIHILTDQITHVDVDLAQTQISELIINSETQNPLFNSSWQIAVHSLLDPVNNKFGCSPSQFSNFTKSLIGLLASAHPSPFFEVLQIACASTASYISSLSTHTLRQTRHKKSNKHVVPSTLIFPALLAKLELDNINTPDEIHTFCPSRMAMNTFWASLHSDTHYNSFDICRVYWMSEKSLK